MDIRRILLPVDGSDISKRASIDAAKLAQLFQSEILLLHCNEITPTLRQPADYSREVVRQANQMLGPSRDILQDFSIAYMEQVVDGPPAQEIPRIAETEQCDLIVMGSTGSNAFEEFFLGSVAENVLKAAPCRVFVVK